MHNIDVTLSQLRSLDGLVILRDISIEDICKPNSKNCHKRWQNLQTKIISI
jgi:type IV secretory pathway VirB4 component